MRKHKNKLSETESEIIHDVIRATYRDGQKGLAAQIGLKQPNLSQYVNGNRTIPPTVAYKIHEALGFNERLSFLRSGLYESITVHRYQRHQTSSPEGLEKAFSMDSVERKWLDLFEAHAQELGTVYLANAMDQRIEILKLLQQTYEKYKQPKPERNLIVIP